MTDHPKSTFARRVRAAAKPRAKRHNVRDDMVSGLILRVYPSGKRTFSLDTMIRGRRRYATIGGAVRPVIESLPGPRDPDACLFPRLAGSRHAHRVVACWRTVCDDAKLGKVRLHDLRHTAASQAVMSGENLPLVGKLLGHRRHETTAGYAHLADGHLVNTAKKVGRLIADAMNLQVVPPSSRHRARHPYGRWF